ncbi:hypothetical protein PSAC2689_40304 [Paraburkholderia sacchari]
MKKISIKRQISQYKKFLASTTPISEALFGKDEDDTVLINADPPGRTSDEKTRFQYLPVSSENRT